ncbi:MAG: hypothetical protein FJ134_14190 [Deltaproteobacteria bacterium]|nr:hypothetical protein [Deltaproteobacteria bacterium]
MYLREKLKQVLGLGFAAGDQGVIEAVEAEHKTLKELKSSLGLPPDATPDKVLAAIHALKVSMEDMQEKRVEEGEKAKVGVKRPWWKWWGK